MSAQVHVQRCRPGHSLDICECRCCSPLGILGVVSVFSRFLHFPDCAGSMASQAKVMKAGRTSPELPPPQKYPAHEPPTRHRCSTTVSGATGRSAVGSSCSTPSKSTCTRGTLTVAGRGSALCCVRLGYPLINVFARDATYRQGGGLPMVAPHGWAGKGLAARSSGAVARVGSCWESRRDTVATRWVTSRWKPHSVDSNGNSWSSSAAGQAQTE